jgi:hypothetical protein
MWMNFDLLGWIYIYMQSKMYIDITFIKTTCRSKQTLVTDLHLTSYPILYVILFINTVKPVLRGHDLWDKEKVVC